MRKVFLAAAAFAAVLTLASCNGDKIAALQNTVDSLQNAKDLSDKELSDKLALISEVEQNFTAIKEAQGLASDAESQEGVNPDKKAQIQENFKLIQDKMAENEQKIADLESQLQQSNGRFAALKSTIANLRKQQQQSQEEIASLKQQLEQKNIEIEDLKTSTANQIAAVNAAKNTSDSINAAKIAEQDAAMHARYYLIDTKKNLKAKGLKAGLKKSDVSSSICTKVDYRKFEGNEGITFKKEPTLYTLHPKASYSITKNADKTWTFTIKNPDEFWSSKYMVLEGEKVQ